MNRYHGELGSLQRSVVALYNNFYNDAFFIKTLVTNGVCHSWCPSGDKFPDPKVKNRPARISDLEQPYGVSYAGAAVKYTITETDGSVRVHQGMQLAQSAYMALQTPYNLFGLGRTNNYVDYLYVGVTRRSPVPRPIFSTSFDTLG